MRSIPYWEGFLKVPDYAGKPHKFLIYNHFERKLTVWNAEFSKGRLCAGRSALSRLDSRFSPTADLAKKNSYSGFRRNMIKHPRNLFLCPGGRFSGFRRFLHGPGYYAAQVILGF